MQALALKHLRRYINHRELRACILLARFRVEHVLPKADQANWQASRIKAWPQPGMCRTYCSSWLALHKDVNKLVLQSGHDSVDTVWRHYHRGTTEAAAKEFWALAYQLKSEINPCVGKCFTSPAEEWFPYGEF